MILNKKNVDPKKTTMFLGESLALQRFDRFKYPVFFDLFNKQMAQFWRPEETNLSLDRVQFPTLEAYEQRIFTKNLLFQTMLDTVVARGVPIFTKYVSLPELELCMNTWGFFENIHSYSYSYIVKNSYPNPGVILDQALEDSEILKRADSVTKAYEELDNAKLDIKEKIYLSLMSVNILEAIRFYVSFACAFCFSHNKKMEGNGSIIKLIRRDEAIHLTITQEILNILRTDESEGFVDIAKRMEPEVLCMFENAVQEEKEWSSYLFSQGSLMGLNEAIMCQYIEWLADNRLHNLGFKKQYNSKNPINWLEPFMNSDKVQVAPQETQIPSYRIGASKSDVDGMDLLDFSLD